MPKLSTAPAYPSQDLVHAEYARLMSKAQLIQEVAEYKRLAAEVPEDAIHLLHLANIYRSRL